MENISKKLTPLQEELLELLKRIHKLCISEGVHYSVYAGTQLGAIREKGFISWDYDADIILKRDEYKKMINVLKNTNLGEDLSFDDMSDRIPKFILHREGKPTVFVDVFIYDYIIENQFFKQIKIYLSLFLAAITKSPEMIEVIRVKEQLKGWKYIIFYLVYLLGRPFPMRTKINFRNWFCEKVLVGHRTLVFCSNTTERYIKKDIHLDNNLDSYIETPFEDTKLLSFENYTEMLLCLYGFDYMIPKRSPKTEFDSHELNRQILEKKWTDNQFK